jgi:hypothetical protein
MRMGGNVDNGLPLVDNVVDDLDSPTSGGIDGNNLRLSRGDAGNVEGGGTVEHTEIVRKVNKGEGITVDRQREYSLRDTLKIWSEYETLASRITGTYLLYSDDTETHRHLYSRSPRS